VRGDVAGRRVLTGRVREPLMERSSRDSG
jgi:hypothetical protein